jgi:hypothetical protein
MKPIGLELEFELRGRVRARARVRVTCCPHPEEAKHSLEDESLARLLWVELRLAGWTEEFAV